MRASISSAIARPGFQQISAAVSVSPSSNSVSQGNPALRPTTAYNFDWSIEHVTQNGSLLSLGLFDKELRNYIVQTTAWSRSRHCHRPLFIRALPDRLSPSAIISIFPRRAPRAEWAREQKLTMPPGALRGLKRRRKLDMGQFARRYRSRLCQ